ncbi:MAG TPA: hypothetical protein PK529_12150 [Verrucomicrobiales bacterium]|nr:hypothetical protein [Verrucomicrobiales bacterium]
MKNTNGSHPDDPDKTSDLDDRKRISFAEKLPDLYDAIERQCSIIAGLAECCGGHLPEPIDRLIGEAFLDCFVLSRLLDGIKDQLEREHLDSDDLHRRLDHFEDEASDLLSLVEQISDLIKEEKATSEKPTSKERPSKGKPPGETAGMV